MRRRIRLYINDKQVDLSDQSIVLFNYTQEDLNNPTIVKNSYSQQITLPGTKTNNKIFGEFWKLDRLTTASSFAALSRADFIILNEMGEVLESGYCKLDGVTNKGINTEYKISLYGGLGSFLFGLMYKDNGDKMSLADLDYLETQDPESEFNYDIDRTIVANAWSVLSGEYQNDLFETINFAPAYNGLPQDFDSKGAVFGDLPVYRATLAREVTEWEAHDLRSYLQRPILRVKKVLEAISNSDNNGGYSVEFPDHWEDQNPYWENLWMTLPMITAEDGGVRSGASFTKRMLLGETMSPAEFLLSYIKMFGFKIVCDAITKKVRIYRRDEFFQNNVRDISLKIDRSKGFEISPFVMESKWYEMNAEMEGDRAEYYASVYGRVYGSQRIDTGYEFNSEVNELTGDVKFKGAAQVMESSSCFRQATKNGQPIPAVFLEGGTYKETNGQTSTEKQIYDSGVYLYTWWDQTNHGQNLFDLVQLHGADNEAQDGSNVLLFFDKMVEHDYLQLSDDSTDMGETPCWNFTETNVRSLDEIPHFSRFLLNSDDEIDTSLEWGQPKELFIANGVFDNDNVSLYGEFWRDYLLDRYDQDSKIVKAWVDFGGVKVGADLLRDFYWFDGAVWVLNKIVNYSMTTFASVECEFIKVKDMGNYITE